MQTYILSFLCGGAYKLYDTLKETNGFYESLPPTLQEFTTILGPSLLAYISAHNGNIPLALLCTIILEKYIQVPFPQISHESHQQEVYILSQLLKKVQTYVSSKLKKQAPTTDQIQKSQIPPLVKKFLDTYGRATVNSIQIRKRPVESFYEKLLSLGSFGKWEECKKHANFDEIYHISLILGFTHESTQHYILLERGEVITIQHIFHTGPEYEFYNVTLPQETLFTIQTFFEKGATHAGPSFYSYHIFENNCQHFVNALLEGNNLQTPEASQFVNQHTHVLQETMPKHVMPVMNQLTNVPLMFLVLIMCLSFSYSNVNLFAMCCTIFYFLLPWLTYKTLFPEQVSLPKIIASCIIWIILFATLLFNYFFDKKIIYNEFLLFSLGYMSMNISNMIAHFTKNVLQEFMNMPSAT